MHKTNSYSFTPIGIVKRPGSEEIAEWNDLNSESFIEIAAEYLSGLKGIEEYSHLMIFFVFHKRRKSQLRIVPEEREDMPEVGVFATNSFLRPNPLGMSVVKLKKINGAKLTITGLDALDGTPVIDIKPFSGFEYETQGYKIPLWLEKLWNE